MSHSFDDGTRLDVDLDEVARWRGDFQRLDGERLLRAVPNPPEPPDEAWRTVAFMEEIDT